MLQKIYKLNILLLLNSLFLIGLSACKKSLSDRKAQQLILGTWKYGEIAEITFESNGKASVKLSKSGIESVTEAFKKLTNSNGSQNGSGDQPAQNLLQSLGISNLDKSLEASYTVTKNKIIITGKTKKTGTIDKLKALPILADGIELFLDENQNVELSIEKLTKTELIANSSSGKKYTLKK